MTVDDNSNRGNSGQEKRVIASPRLTLRGAGLEPQVAASRVGYYFPCGSELLASNRRNGQSAVANCVNMLPCDLGGDMASVSLDAPVAARHQEDSGYRHDHACRTRGCPIGSDRGHGACRRCVGSPMPRATELAHAGMCDRCSVWPGAAISHLKVAVTPNSALRRT
jgi:hypothetical protein